MFDAMQWDEWTSEERLIAQQAVENFRAFNRACDEAADGRVLAVAESLAMRQGRELIRKTLEASLSGQAQGVEKKGRRAGRAPAAWIWEEQRRHLTHAAGVLDVFHAVEHIAATAKAVYGEGAVATDWTDAGRTVLLADGFTGIDRQIEDGLKATRSPRKREALQSLRNYLQPHEHHLGYRTRLAEGKSIGSGQVEGACKNLIGRRLKQTGARWRTRRVNRMTGLCSLLYSNQWDAYWNRDS